MSNTAIITAIKHFAVHDGDGIRTTVFFKGCGLKCLWCHNPEGILFEPQISYMDEKCLNCKKCGVCHANSMVNGKHVFDRRSCSKCGNCVQRCSQGAFKQYGREMTLDEVFAEVTEDKPFYLNSGGGVTLSGGEALYHTDFCVELLKRLKEQEIHTAVDTSGFVPEGAIEKALPYTDIFLFDLKAAKPDVHKKLTGKDNLLILKNLHYIDNMGTAIEIRIPFVPGCNDSEMQGIAEIIAGLKNVKRVKLLPYHSYARSRYSALGMEDTLPELTPDAKSISAARLIFKKRLPSLEII